MRHAIIPLLCLLTVATVGCRTGPSVGPASSAPELAAPPADGAGNGPQPERPAPATSSEVMATVNGRPISMDRLTEPLVTVYGPRLAEMLIVNALVVAEADRRGLTASAGEIAAEHRRSLEGVFGGDLATGERVLDQLLRQRGLTRDLWNATMRQNALLRKMVADKIKVSDEMLRSEYARQYGDKVLVRHVQVADIHKAEAIIAQLKKGKDFAELAKAESTNTATAAQGGLLPAFTADDATIPQAIRDAAFALAAPGDLSGIVQVQDDFHVLRLENKIAAAAEPFEKVRPAIETAIRERMTLVAQAQFMAELRRRADVQYVNPTLTKAAREQRSEQQQEQP